MLGMAMLLGSLALCARRQVGCILTDKDGLIVGTGYNGRISGLPNCQGEQVCIDYCEGMHAEINALLRRKGDPACAFVTCMPCSHCIKALIAAGATRLVVGTGEMDEEQRHGQKLWSSYGYEILEINCNV